MIKGFEPKISLGQNFLTDERFLRQLVEQTPLGRLGKPEDIAEAVAFLADERASFITGQVLTADGGFIL